MDMYSKIGNAISTQEIFPKLEKKDEMACASIITSLAIHGLAKKALNTFKRMLMLFLMGSHSFLCACSHVGLVEEGQSHFASLSFMA